MISVSDIGSIKSAAQVDKLVEGKFDGDVDAFALALSRTFNELLHHDLTKASRFVKHAIRILQLLGQPYKPRALALEARYRHHVGDSAEALRLYRRAATLLKQRNDYPALARLRMGQMDVFMYLGKYDQAREVGRKALAQFRRRNDTVNEARVLTNLGNVYHRLDRNATALGYYDKAREIFAKDAGVPLAIIELNRANIMANLNKLSEARRLYERSADIFERHQVELNAAKVRYSVAYLHYLADDYTDAISLLEQLHDRLKQLGDTRTASVAHLDLSEICLQINQAGSAAMLAERLVPQFKKLNMTYELGKAYYFAGSAHGQLHNFKRAAQWLSEAHALFKREDNKLWLGMVAFRRARLALDANRPTDCLKHLVHARAEFQRADDRRRLIDVDLLQLEALLRSGRSVETERLKLRLQRVNLVSYQRYLYHHTLGRHAQLAGDHRLAARELKRAVDIVEKMIAGMYPDEIRSFFLLDKADAYLALVESLLALGKTDDAFTRQLQSLRTLNGQIPSQRLSDAGVPSDLLDTRENLRARLNRLAVVQPGGQRMLDSQRDFRRLEQKLWSNEQRIRSYRYPEAERSKGQGLPLSSIEAPRDTTIVSFIDAAQVCGAFVRTNHGTTFVPLQTDRQDLSVRLREMQFVLERSVYSCGSQAQRRAIDFYLSQLYQVVFEPLEKHINTRKVYLMVDGLASQVPFWAMVDRTGKPLIDRFEFAVLCNPEDVRGRDTRKESRLVDAQSAIFGVASTHLPAIDEEMQIIAQLFPGAKIYEKEKATVREARLAMETSDGFVHIATHASRSTENPLFSRLLMTDGPLYPFDLFGSGIKSRLVVLSGCQTAAPGLYFGNSFSLAKAFYLAGSRQVLATLWPVSDSVSTGFMGRFYSSLRNNEDVLGAYHAALRQTRDEVEHPALWAPFILIGI